MRHRKSGRKLGRNPSHRKALLRNMASALITYGRITTTEAKAKTLRGVIEPLITLAIKDDVHARRQAYRVLNDHQLVKRLFDEIGPLFKDGGGGYTRVVKLALPRKGDSAPLAIIEFTRKPGDTAPAKKAKAAPAKKAAAEAAAPETPAKAAEPPAEEAPAKGDETTAAEDAPGAEVETPAEAEAPAEDAEKNAG